MRALNDLYISNNGNNNGELQGELNKLQALFDAQRIG